MIDTETANTLTDEKGNLNMEDVLFYDVGFAIVDKYGKVYHSASYVNKDIFLYERELMHSAYYAKKIPQYFNDLRSGARTLASLYEIQRYMMEIIQKYNITTICAHNARFDANALNRTISFVTKARKRYWFPYNSIEWWDTMKMAQSVVAKMPTYIKFCQRNNYMTKTGKVKVTAEILYKFITKNPNFKESHTGLEDVMIEKEILAYCFRQHKPMKKNLWDNTTNNNSMTDFQRQLWKSLKTQPTMRV